MRKLFKQLAGIIALWLLGSAAVLSNETGEDPVLPATPHQMQVLNMPDRGYIAREGDLSRLFAERLPASEHQIQVLRETFPQAPAGSQRSVIDRSA